MTKFPQRWNRNLKMMCTSTLTWIQLMMNSKLDIMLISRMFIPRFLKMKKLFLFQLTEMSIQISKKKKSHWPSKTRSILKNKKNHWQIKIIIILNWKTLNMKWTLVLINFKNWIFLYSLTKHKNNQIEIFKDSSIYLVLNFNLEI